MSYCPKCGKEIKEDAVFCPFCGESLKKEQIVYMRSLNEKDEQNEKDERNEKGEKNEKSEKNETSGGMWNGVFGGLILLWLGLSFILRQYGYISSANWGSLFLIGLGIVIILRGIVMYAEIGNWRASRGFMVGGGVVVLIGVGTYLELSNWWAVLLILVGGWVLLSALTNKEKHPRP